jgi:hypothetical protein
MIAAIKRFECAQNIAQRPPDQRTCSKELNKPIGYIRYTSRLHLNSTLKQYSAYTARRLAHIQVKNT